MNPYEHLRVRVQQTLEELECARERLKSDSMPSRFRKRIGRDFWEELDACALSLRELCPNPSAPSQTPLSVLWSAFEAHREKAEGLVRECMSLIQGAIARDRKVDNGLCDIADTLVEELEDVASFGWRRFTLPADGESLTHVGQVIRVRFPAQAIWSIPVAAHEFGHFAGRKMTTPDQDGDSAIFATFLREVAERQGSDLEVVQRSHYREFFADLFATYVLGPAFVCTCLLLRFDPCKANVSTPTHPSDGRRAHAMISLIKRMSIRSGVTFSGVPDLVEQRWLESRRDAGQPADSDEQTARKQLDVLALKMDARLHGSNPALEYTTWTRAQELCAALVRAEPATSPSTRVTDLLNAAWLARLQGEDVGSLATKWALQVVAAREHILPQGDDQ
jgi:hypothetical protein